MSFPPSKIEHFSFKQSTCS